ncbi:MAG: DNA polymerase III subunit delta [Desulfobacteraceae bacterium 4572_87]|nr:MAG: DNA polymerase III subunit delta [Desulfobacteraceae bacterium 4572_87]
MPVEIAPETVLKHLQKGCLNPIYLFHGPDLDAVRSMPFLSSNRLVIVRRADHMSAPDLAVLIPYVEKPVDTACLVLVAQKPDFRLKFFKRIRQLGHSVNFSELSDRQAIPWIKTEAREIGLNIKREACRHLHEIIGNRSRTLHTELEKLYLRHGSKEVGVSEIKELSIFSRMYTIFELMDEISQRRKAESLSILNRFTRQTDA